MAIIADNPAVQRLIQAFHSVGANFSDPNAVTEDEFRRESVRFLSMLNNVLADSPTAISTIDAPTLQNFRTLLADTMGQANEHGKTPLQMLEALATGNTEFLVEDVTGTSYGVISNQNYARGEFNNIFRGSGTPAEKARRALEFAAENDEGTAALLRNLRTHAPGVLNDLPAAVALLKGSDAVLADLQTLVDTGLYTGQTVDPATLGGGAGEYQTAITALETLAGSTSQDGVWDATDKQAMQVMFRTMQNSQYFGQGWTGPKDGVYDAAFRAHLDGKLANMADTDPRKAQLETMLGSIDVLLARSETVTPERLNIRSATLRVEQGLAVLAPQINTMLEDAQGRMSGATGLAALFQSFAQVGILDHRIPVISTPDENFDLRSQAALQGLMVFLSDPMVMNIPGENNWYYTPQKGQIILANIDNLKDKIKRMIGEEEYNRQNLDTLLTRENLEPLVQALDFLATQDPPRLSQQLLFNQGNVDIASYTANLFQSLISEPVDQETRDYLASFGAHRLAGMSTNNPDMLRLMEVLTREFTGQYGLLELMPDLEGTDAIDDIDGSIPRDQLIANLYKAARAKHEENGHGATLDDDLFIMISTINTLPFGSNEYRRNYERMMRDAIKEASEISDPDEAARVFAERVRAGTAQLEAQNGGPRYMQTYERDAPAWKPGLENFTITSGGQTVTASDIAVFYDNYHIMAPGNPFQDDLGTDFLELHGYVTFKDDAGNIYVAGIDKESMVFSIERIDVDRLNEIYSDESVPRAERLQRMVEADRGFALLAGIEGVGRARQTLVSHNAFDRAQSYHVIAEHYQRDVDGIRERTAAEQAERDAYIPPYSNSVSATANNAPSTAARFGTAAGPPDVFSDTTRDRTQILSDLDALRNFANDELNSSPRVIMAHETGIMDMLRRNDVRGPDGRPVELPVGSYPGIASLRVEQVDLPPEGTTGQMLAYFDFDANTVRVIPMPDYLVDPDRRAELKAMAANGADTEEFMRSIQREYPELFAVVQQYRTGGYGGGVVVEGSPIGRNEYTQFKASMHGLIRSLERDIRDHAYVEPVEPRTADTFWDNMRNARDGVINTPGRIGRHYQERYGDFSTQGAGEAIQRIPERAADGFVSVVTAIGSRAEEVADQITGERESTGLSHQVHGIATGAPDPGLNGQ